MKYKFIDFYLHYSVDSLIKNHKLHFTIALHPYDMSRHACQIKTNMLYILSSFISLNCVISINCVMKS